MIFFTLCSNCVIILFKHFYYVISRNNYEKRALDRDLADREQGFEIGDIMVLFEDGKIVITRDGKKPQNVAVTNFPDTIILCSEDMERIC